MAAVKVECPVCGKGFPFPSINTHVNECLKAEKEEENDGKDNKDNTIVSPDDRLIKQENDDDNGGSDSNSRSWGSLMPYSTGSKKSKLGSSPKLNSKHAANTNKNNNSPANNNNNHSSPANNNNNSSSCPNTITSRKRKHFPVLNEYTFDIESKGSNPGKDSGRQATSGQMLSLSAAATTTATTTTTSPGGGGARVINFDVPLAESSRPKTIEAFVGQHKSIGAKSFIGKILRNYSVPPSLIFWGPPGSGKTTLAKLISRQCRENHTSKLVMMSATNSGVNDVKQAAQAAKTNQKMFKVKTVLFIDEIHRFNKTQQDCLLPHVEDGTFILLGATTENPSFHVNSALLSRCHVVVLEKLSIEDVSTILLNAVESLTIKRFSDASEIDKHPADKEGRPNVWINNKVIEEISSICDGDGRVALNCLQMAVQSQMQKNTGGADVKGDNCPPTIIDVDCVKGSLERCCILYDKKGEEHYNCASALQKSIRGSDADAALYWVARMLEGGENPLFVARRLVRTASEDIGLADPLALTHAVAAFQATTFLGMPECDVILAQCAIYLARAPKSFEAYSAYGKAKRCIHEHKGPLPSVPLHLRNASNSFMKSLGYGKGYVPHGRDNTTQTYLPSELSHMKFLE